METKAMKEKTSAAPMALAGLFGCLVGRTSQSPAAF
jgi:hypothetical protein